MDEYIKEAEDVSFEGTIGESYDKEWALKDQALRDGYLEGKEEGREEEKNKIAITMKKNNVDIDKIAMYTGLSEEEINQLKI